MSDQQKRRLLAAAIAVLTFVVYLPALRNGFVSWDDGVYVYNNPHIRALDTELLHWAFVGFHAGNWHPLTWLSHALDYALWGLNPAGHHLTSIVLHALNTGLVALLSLRLLEAAGYATTGKGGNGGQLLWGGGMTAALFGLHPLHVESAAWVAERKDLLCALFCLLSIQAYLAYAGRAQEGGARSAVRRRYGAALAWFALALLAKPMAVSLPVVLLILDWWPLDRLAEPGGCRRVWGEKVPFLALGFGSAALTFLAQHAGGAMVPLRLHPLSVRLAVACRALLEYLAKMVWPADLIPFYAYPRDLSLLSAAGLLPVALVAAAVFALLVVRKQWPGMAAAWAYYGVTLFPVLGFVQVGGQAMADRYTYLPSLGPFLLAGAAVARGARYLAELGKPAWLKGTGGALLGSLLALLAWLSVGQMGVWRDSLGLWSRVIERAAVESEIPYNNRGEVLAKEGRFVEAIEDYGRALAVSPADVVALNNRGTAFEGIGRADLALEDYDRAIAIDPAYARAYYNRGMLLGREGRYPEALRDYDRAIALEPSEAKAYNNRGIVRGLAGDGERARQDFDRAITLDPTHAGAYFNRGNLLLRLGDGADARKDFRTACGLGYGEGCAAVLRLDGAAAVSRPERK